MNATTLPAPLSVTLQMDAKMYTQLQRYDGALESAKAYVIDSPDMAELANEDLRQTKLDITLVEKWKAGFVEPANQIIANASALFDTRLASLRAAEAYHKQNLLNYTTEQKRLADEARRKQEADEREARQKAEREAAAARAAAQEKAAAEAKKAREAEEAAERARQEGNAKEAARLAAQAAKANEAANAAIENGNAKAADALIKAEAAMPAPIAAPAKIAGFSTRENWVAELAPGMDEAKALEAIVAQIGAGRRDLLALLTLNMSAAGKLAKAQKALFSVPGLVAKNRPVAASRAA